MTDTPTQAPVPDELVRAAEEFFRAYWHLAGTAASQCSNRIAPEEMASAGEAHDEAFRRLQAALSLPRRTEAELLAQGAADERGRLIKSADDECANITDCTARIKREALAASIWLRYQGGEYE